MSHICQQLNYSYHIQMGAISTLSTSLKRGDLKGRRTRKTWKIPAGQPVFLNLLNDPFKPLEKLLRRLLEK